MNTLFCGFIPIRLQAGIEFNFITEIGNYLVLNLTSNSYP